MITRVSGLRKEFFEFSPRYHLPAGSSLNHGGNGTNAAAAIPICIDVSERSGSCRHFLARRDKRCSNAAASGADSLRASMFARSNRPAIAAAISIWCLRRWRGDVHL